MRNRKRLFGTGLILTLILTLVWSVTVLAAEGDPAPEPAVYATIWSLLPPLVAIVLALITKEVYSSLFIGILVGALFYSNFNFEGTVVHLVEEGFISVLADPYKDQDRSPDCYDRTGDPDLCR